MDRQDSKNANRFDSFYREIVNRTCVEWDLPIPGEDYFSQVYRHLPLDLQSMISFGLSKGLFHVFRSKTGSAGFRPIGVPNSKGPYSFFWKDDQKRELKPYYEYLVQLAEYIRLYEAIQGKPFEIHFEKNRMDIALYDGQRLMGCYEIKEKASEALKLVEAVKQYGEYEVLPTGSNKYLKKAKYIVSHKPEYFSVVAIGVRFEFKVEYPSNKQFRLIEDLIPIL